MKHLLSCLERTDFIPVRNRMAMSPMSRSAATSDNLATSAMRDYYRRRAEEGAGLILTEGTIIHRSGAGWNNAPHIETDAQADSWRKITQAVHEAGAAIACQLWHMGRISHSDFTAGAPVSSTSRAASGINRQNGKPYGKPRALPSVELPAVYGYFADAARRALEAGFDAVELHAGHGYLPDQFLDGNVNDRTDDYGGSIENRCRFLLELVDAVLQVAPAQTLIVRISPSRFMAGIYEWPDIGEMLEFLIPALRKAGLVALDVSCANSDYFDTAGKVLRKIRPMWDGVLLGGASLTAEQAEAEIAAGWLDLVTWGRAFIANPDLPTKILHGRPWTPFAESMRGSLE